MSRYDIEEKNNRFMEFISREMMRNKRNRSYVEQPKPRNSRGLLVRESERQKQRERSVADIYSHTQITRQRRGASVLKSTGSKSRYNESREKKPNMSKESSLNFYEGLKRRNAKPKEQTTVTVGMLNQDEVELQELHYEMVKMQHNVKKLQSNI